ncbi:MULTISPECIES: Maf family protein [Gallibacterium]|uniref:dTTP/UTP pyrophosphatase n=1 Tax=Gallibacterium genomosp. 3 TaxID=505345 RepID=A0A1A7NXC0_9PAST|nr:MULTISPECIES: nucleoside triphosphate pyrophosphatase [Gallibacterium]MDA3978770.1 Maf family protein [Gallibacterium sp. AGMB14963]OBW93639.1 septum formation inhibitor Maf [Gallibacterium genomosp. 3]
MDKKIYLGSNSPRRLQLLQQIGLTVEVLKAEIDETPLAQEKAQDYVCRMAISKNQRIRQLFPDKQQYPLLTADTCIALDGKILGKPTSEEHAFSMLQSLSGKTHQVLTAVAISDQHRLLHHLQSSQVTFKTLTDLEIKAYIATGEPLDKAGAYAIQGLAAIFIENLTGSYSGVMGLPLFETAQLLQQFKQKIL